jgi:heavy metal translocating P-type ATPase
MMSILTGPLFRIPLLILALSLAGWLLQQPAALVAAIAIGLLKLVWESVEKIREGRWSLDYIAMLAMGTALFAHEYGAGAVIALMITLSGALEEFGAERAEASLEALIARIPKNCLVKNGTSGYIETPLQQVKEKALILIKQNELVPLDGFLRSERATLNQANLTGEADPQELQLNDFIKSGCINVGASIEIEVVGTFATSSYQKIIDLVAESKKHPANLVRVAQKFNWPFTAITLVVAGTTYALTQDITRLLAVLAVATPCPLLIAAPIAFLGGMNKAARKNIIIKKPSVLESLAGIQTIFFDKTGTLTLGTPALRSVQIFDKNIDENHALVIAAAIELHSLHPLARAITTQRSARSLADLPATKVEEVIGKGISGEVEGVRYSLTKSAQSAESGIFLDMHRGETLMARFLFEDQMKENVVSFLAAMKKEYSVAMLTGDKKENAQALFGDLGITIHAGMLPEHKFTVVKTERDAGRRVAMVGDGLNDAPALALADAGIVFSGTENSASIEAASAAILSHDIMLVQETFSIARRSTAIAKQSIIIGIGLSIVGMGFAAFGFITPVMAAIIQEIIDVGVTINALRAAK